MRTHSTSIVCPDRPKHSRWRVLGCALIAFALTVAPTGFAQDFPPEDEKIIQQIVGGFGDDAKSLAEQVSSAKSLHSKLKTEDSKKLLLIVLHGSLIENKSNGASDESMKNDYANLVNLSVNIAGDDSKKLKGYLNSFHGIVAEEASSSFSSSGNDAQNWIGALAQELPGDEGIELAAEFAADLDDTIARANNRRLENNVDRALERRGANTDVNLTRRDIEFENRSFDVVSPPDWKNALKDQLNPGQLERFEQRHARESAEWDKRRADKTFNDLFGRYIRLVHDRKESKDEQVSARGLLALIQIFGDSAAIGSTGDGMDASSLCPGGVTVAAARAACEQLVGFMFIEQSDTGRCACVPLMP